MEWNREFRYLAGLQMLIGLALLLVVQYGIKDEKMEVALLSIATGIALAVSIQVVWCGVSSEMKKKVTAKNDWNKSR